MRWFALAKLNLITGPVLRYAAPHNTSLSQAIKAITGLASAFEPISKNPLTLPQNMFYFAGYVRIKDQKKK
jgi:hypothetical protein